MLVQNMKEVESFHDILKYESETFVYYYKNKMELLQSQAPAERELLGNSADRTLDIGV